MQQAVASGTSSVTLVNANSARKGLVITNSDANRLHVQLSTRAEEASATTTTAYSFSLAQNENACLPGFTGAAYGIWAADGSGHALVTEY